MVFLSMKLLIYLFNYNALRTILVDSFDFGSTCAISHQKVYAVNCDAEAYSKKLILAFLWIVLSERNFCREVKLKLRSVSLILSGCTTDFLIDKETRRSGKNMFFYMVELMLLLFFLCDRLEDMWRFLMGLHMDGLWDTRLKMRMPWSALKRLIRTC